MPLLVSVSPYVPQRRSPYAGHQWYFHYLVAMARHHHVVIVAPATRENRAAVPGAPAEVHLVPGRGHWSASEGQRGPLDKLSDELLAGVLRLDGPAADLVGRATVVDLQWPRALPHAPALRRAAPTAVLTYVAHDLHWTNWTWSRLRQLPMGKGLAGLAVGVAVGRREVRLVRSVDAVFAFKQQDLEALRRRGVTRPGSVLAPWLERPAAPPGPPAGHHVLYVAAFDRAPNRWGAEWLLRRVWPAVVARVPDARLVLAGGGPPPELREAAARATNVEVTGFVEDLDAWYRRAACVVAPVLGGAGLRFKVPQAMLARRPLVVTPLALEGLDAPADCFAGVTAEPGAFADAVVSALAGDGPAAAAADRAARWVEEHLSFERSMEAVVATQRGLQHRNGAPIPPG